jgi:WhiB family redox-sensing transcriptional regulator
MELTELNLNQAACTDVADPDIFFPEGKDALLKMAMAKEICADCPIVADCLQYAVEHDEPGIWGGTTEDERKVMRRRRKIIAIKVK